MSVRGMIAQANGRLNLWPVYGAFEMAERSDEDEVSVLVIGWIADDSLDLGSGINILPILYTWIRR